MKPSSISKYTPLTGAMRALLSDPTTVVSEHFASLAQTSVELLAQADKLNGLIRQELAADTAGKIEAENKAAGELEVQLALAETDAEKKRLTPALKKARESVQDATDAHAQSLIRLKAYHARLVPIEQEIEAHKAEFRNAAPQHGGHVAALITEELRAAVLALQPLLRVAAAAAAGSQSRGLWNALQELKIVDPTNSAPILAGTRYGDWSRPMLVGTVTFPTSQDLTEGWAEDPVLQAIRAAAAAPLQVLQRLEAFKPVAQLEAEEARQREYEARDRRPTSLPRTKRADASMSDTAAQPIRGLKPHDLNPRTGRAAAARAAAAAASTSEPEVTPARRTPPPVDGNVADLRKLNSGNEFD